MFPFQLHNEQEIADIDPGCSHMTLRNLKTETLTQSNSTWLPLIPAPGFNE